VHYDSSFRARPNVRSMKIFVQSIIADISTVDDTAIIILSAFAAVRSTDLCRHDVEGDALSHSLITLLRLHRIIKLCRFAGHITMRSQLG